MRARDYISPNHGRASAHYGVNDVRVDYISVCSLRSHLGALTWANPTVTRHNRQMYHKCLSRYVGIVLNSWDYKVFYCIECVQLI